MTPTTRIPWRTSIRLRLTAWYALALFIAFSVAAIGLRQAVGFTLRDEYQTALTNSAEFVQTFFGFEVSEYPSVEATAEHLVEELVFPAHAVEILRPDGTRVVARHTGHQRALDLAGRTHSVLLPLDRERAPGWQVRVSASTTSLDRPLGRVDLWLGGALVASVLAAAAGAWWLAGRALRPIAAMAAATDRITAAGQGERLPVANAHDELGRLGTRVNALLDRLDAALAQQRQFLADAAHELRTPIARMRSRVDLALQPQTPSEGDARDTLEAIDRDLTRTTDLVDELLQLARADAGVRCPRLELAFVDDVVMSAVQAWHIAIERRGLRLDVETLEEAPAHLDPVLVDRLVGVLLDNASRYTPSGGRITVSVRRGHGAAVLEVSDTGIGMSDAERARAFERFYRGERARGMVPDGSGLGLPIAAWIATVHRATLTLAPNDAQGGGTTARVVFPPTHHPETVPPLHVDAIETSAGHGAAAAIALAMCVALGSPLHAQSCTVQRSEVAPAAFSGQTIRAVDVVTQAPRAGALARVPLLHGRTHAAVIRRELQFAPGDTVDTLRVAQSLRQVRALGFLDDSVFVEARRCAGDIGVALRVVTRDVVSVSPMLRVRGADALVGLRERNALGSGVAARIALRDDGGRLGIESAASAPGLLGASTRAEAGLIQYGHGHTLFASIAPRTPWPTTKWIVDGQALASTLAGRSAAGLTPGLAFDRRAASLLLGRRLNIDAPASTYLVGGPEIQRADVTAGGDLHVIGPREVRRDYLGMAIGVRRSALRFDTVSWLLPRGALLDVPRGLEGDVLVSGGRDGQARAAHVDAWVGHTATIGSGATIAATDAWASAYVGDERLASSTLRGTFTLLHAAPNGRWTIRAGVERLLNPDPDVRALALRDPLSPALPHPARLSEAAIALSAERAVHLSPLGRAGVLDGAGFVAASSRWDASGATHAEALGVAAAGVGVRLVPSHAGRASLRLDLGVPLFEYGGARRRPFVGFSFTPWTFGDRQREGRRLP